MSVPSARHQPPWWRADSTARAADQYALAATAFHPLTGGPVFDHSNPAVVISRHLNAEPPALSDRLAELAVVDPVMQRALAKDPTERSAAALTSPPHSAAPWQITRTIQPRAAEPTAEAIGDLICEALESAAIIF